MAKDLFVLTNNNRVEPLTKHDYEWEQVLQRLIADNPALISRKRTGEDPTLYLVAREVGVYNQASDQVARYSLDHLYVSGDGVPVIVEVKRSSDTRLRREVVAQMIDYACRASLWNVEELRQMALQSNSLSEEADSLLNSPDFWSIVDSNLKAEKLRMVFVADEIPNDLIPMINFLDSHLSSIDVYGVSLTRYQSNGSTMFIKNIIERPEVTDDDSLPSREWNDSRFLAQATKIGGQPVYDVTKKVIDWAKSAFKHCGYGNGKYYARFIAYPTDTTTGHIFTIEPWGDAMRIRFSAQWNAYRSSHSEEELWEMAMHISDVPDYINPTPKYVTIDCRAFNDEEAFDRFKELILEIYNHKTITPPPDK